MFKINLASTVIQINNHFDYVEKQCCEFITNEDPSIIVSLSLTEIKKEQSELSESLDYCESLAVYRKICMELIKKNTFLFHGAFFTYKEKGIIFIGPSGVGKTTQMKKWQAEAFDKIKIINGDKPLFQLKEQKLIGYGTPWSGKENLHLNAKAELKAIFVVLQSETSYIEKITSKEAIPLLLNQLFFPNNKDGNLILINIAKEILKTIPVFKFHGILDQESAKQELMFLENNLGE